LKAYADTSFLVSLYFSDAHTDRASRLMARRTDALPFTPFHRHEFRNAIRLAVRRQQMGETERREIFRSVESDLKESILAHQSISWTDAFREAERIGEAQTEQTGIRSADLLHIGIALTLNAEEFLTFDAIQREVAISAGFKCNP
jgi:predicted nucleic acid-binding protein